MRAHGRVPILLLVGVAAAAGGVGVAGAVPAGPGESRAANDAGPSDARAPDARTGDARAPDARAPDAGGEAGAKQPAVPKCIRVSTAAVFSGGGYDHVVTIESSCDKDARCQVSTNVAEEVLEVEVPAGETRDLVTFRGSPTSEFEADVRCALSK